MWQFCADHEQKQELGDETITRGLDTTRPITEALLWHSGGNGLAGKRFRPWCRGWERGHGRDGRGLAGGVGAMA